MKKRNRLLLVLVGTICICFLLIMMTYGRIAIWAMRIAPAQRVAFGMLLSKNHITQHDLPLNFTYRDKKDNLAYYSARDEEKTQYFDVKVVSRPTGRDVLSDFLFDREGTCLLWRSDVHLIRADHASGLYDFTGDGSLEKVIAYQAKPAKDIYDSFLEIWDVREDSAKLLLKVAFDATYSAEDGHYEFVTASIKHNRSSAPGIELLGPNFEELVVFSWSSEEQRFIASSKEGKLWRLHVPSTAGNEESL